MTPANKPLSVQRQVAGFVIARGRADFDEIVAGFPNLDRKRVRSAIYNACTARLIVLESRGVGNLHMVQAVSVYRALRPEEGKVIKQPVRVASVWDLGTPRVFVLSPMQGRRYQPLGDWSEA